MPPERIKSISQSHKLQKSDYASNLMSFNHSGKKKITSVKRNNADDDFKTTSI